jgi:hypothetical protein
MGRKHRPWSAVLPLSNITKADYCHTDQQRRQANALVETWLRDNPQASIEEQINFASVLMLWLQFSACVNANMTMDGKVRDDATTDHDRFDEIKASERKMLPTLHKQLMDALSKSGRTGAQKKISEDIRTSAEAATLVFQKHGQVDGDHQ